MTYELKVKQWLKEDNDRMDALVAAAELKLTDWCLSAGFVRNLVWDKLHGKRVATELNDIDLIYFDEKDLSQSREKYYERDLSSRVPAPWSVKNQARMHIRNDDPPYKSVEDAMTYWVEVETAIGAYVRPNGDLELVAPLGLQSLFDLKVTINTKRPKPEIFSHRVEGKGWLERWPLLKIEC
jgi:hypothetical protein